MRKDGAVDADKRAVHVHERATGIAAIDGGICLDEESVVTDANLGARERRDDAAGDRLLQAERVADGDDEIADLCAVLGVGEAQCRQALVRITDAQHGEIDTRIGEHQFGVKLAPIVEDDLQRLGAFDDVVVGDDDAVSADDEPEPNDCSMRGAPKRPKNGSRDMPPWLIVLFDWAGSYFTFARQARVVADPDMTPPAAGS